MKQMITRIDRELDLRLKARAKEEGRSVNSLVTELLQAAVVDESPRERLRRRLAESGLLVVVPRPEGRILSREAAIALTAGAGTSVSEALEEDRNSR